MNLSWRNVYICAIDYPAIHNQCTRVTGLVESVPGCAGPLDRSLLWSACTHTHTHTHTHSWFMLPRLYVRTLYKILSYTIMHVLNRSFYDKLLVSENHLS